MTPAGRRLFFALWPDDGVRDALGEWQRHCLPQDVQPTLRADLHMTLHFLGQVETTRLAELELLGDYIKQKVFDLQLDELGFFARPQVLWAGPSEAPPALLRMQQALGEGLAQMDFPCEKRAFSPHVTLARKVKAKPQVADLTSISWRVSQWALVESRSGRRPLYAPLALWDLD